MLCYLQRVAVYRYPTYTVPVWLVFMFHANIVPMICMIAQLMICMIALLRHLTATKPGSYSIVADAITGQCGRSSAAGQCGERVLPLVSVGKEFCRWSVWGKSSAVGQCGERVLPLVSVGKEFCRWSVWGKSSAAGQCGERVLPLVSVGKEFCRWSVWGKSSAAGQCASL